MDSDSLRVTLVALGLHNFEFIVFSGLCHHDELLKSRLVIGHAGIHYTYSTIVQHWMDKSHIKRG